MNEKGKLIVITGSTASGKSALAVELAKELQTEIISADSRQIYKGIPIVTAIPSIEEREGIPHHLMEEKDLTEYFSASLFEQQALEKIKELLDKNNFAIVCGGSMMYVDALCNGIDELPTVPEELRNSLMEQWKKEGDEWLKRLLFNLDPDYWKQVDLHNLKRVFHAVELSLTAGIPYSKMRTGKKVSRPFEIFKYCLTGERSLLFERINHRVEVMMAKDLEKEARGVYHLRHLNSLNTVGLKEMFDYFDGHLSLEDAVKRIQKNTRVYAKKQETWHKKDVTLRKLDFSDDIKSNVEKILKDIG